ncbi:MAG: hypothetical protein R2747_18370 [Pyrinomonadaceae bacterium]
MKNKKLFLTAFLLVCVAATAACFSISRDNDEPSSTPRNNRTSTPKTGKQPTPDEDNKNESGKNSNEKMNGKSTSEIKDGGFAANLPAGFSQPTDPVGKKMLGEYGAMFVAKGGAAPPPKVVFNNESEVSAWQSGISKSSENIGGATIELQTPAMNALKEAIDEAKQNGKSITPRGGSDAGRRDYSGTVTNWKSRVDPGLTYWVGKGRLPQNEANRIKGLPIPEQISEIFKLESQGMYFSTGKDKSIIYSVAPPGTSQHISMLALDVAQHEDSKVRAILAKHGWFQTVVSDLPHFTYLGVSESDLPKLGLKKVSDGGRVFWIPE